MVSLEQIQTIRTYSRTFVQEIGLLNQRAADLDISYTEGHILLELERVKGLSSKELARNLHVDKSLISKLALSLNRRGLIKFGTSSTDQRVKPLFLTSKGKGKLKIINESADTQVAGALNNLSDTKIETIIKGLQEYSRALRSSRILSEITIRPIKEHESSIMEQIILDVSNEFVTAGEGGPTADLKLGSLCAQYSGKGSAYFVVEHDNSIIGGGGISALRGADSDICELQKMYVLNSYRGAGIGHRIVEACLNKARVLGYKRCYLETVKRMDRAVCLYEKLDFNKLKAPLGDTGHHQSELWFLKEL